jgi:hypothetical protein
MLPGSFFLPHPMSKILRLVSMEGEWENAAL